jgi:hypothetical protein
MKELLNSSQRVIKSHCQWCGVEIHYDEHLHSLWGNGCRECNIDFARLVRELIDRKELNHRIKLRANPHENELWKVGDDYYKVNTIFNTCEKLVPLALTHTLDERV